jgi:plasmid stabilization system protein ParE
MYVLIYSTEAIEEYEKSVLWYLERSERASENFKLAILNTVESIKNNPWQFRNSYKKYYEAVILKYPFSIVFTIDDDKKFILILSLIHI